MMEERRKRENLHLRQLLDLLVAKGLVTQEMVELSRAEKEKLGIDLTQALDHLGFIKQEKIVEVEAEMLQLPYVNLAHYAIDKKCAKSMTAEFSRKYKALPLFQIKNTVVIGMADPLDVNVQDRIRQLYPANLIEIVQVLEGGIFKFLDHHSTIDDSFEDMIRALEEEKSEQQREMIERAGDSPIVRLVNMIIKQAVKDKSSDIHIEPCRENIRVRFRTDGVLNEVMMLPKKSQGALISRIKIMCDMDIAESRKPQDGRARVSINDNSVDFRVSVFPSLYGENIVIRLMDKSVSRLGLKNLGAEKDVMEKLNHVIHQPHGIILITGPTGSGKTTTLYSILAEINTMEKNIITLEDPIEYELPIIRQTQINERAGVTFATGLRSILRQDPDVVMLGEIRDRETAEISIQAALTGHLVLSTLHTNDAASSVTRLMNMGIEPFLIASSMIGVMAQRLVRLICVKCKEMYTVKNKALNEPVTLWKGKGCQHCKNSGYSGRMAIFELLVVSEDIRQMVLARNSAEAIKNKAITQGMKLLREDGMRLVQDQLTTIDEVMIATRIE